MSPIEPSSSKDAVITQLTELLVLQNRCDQRYVPQIVQQVLQRERFGSSAIGNGIAIPHARTPFIDQFVGAVGIASHGIDFGSSDRRPTKLIFLTLAPFHDRDGHVLMLSRLAHLMKDERLSMHLLHAITADDLFALLADMDGESP